MEKMENKIDCNQKVTVETMRLGRNGFGFGLLRTKRYHNDKPDSLYSNRVQFSWHLLLQQIEYHLDLRSIQLRYGLRYGLAFALLTIALKYESYALFIGAIALDGSVIEAPQDTATQSMTINTGSDRVLIMNFATYQGGQPTAVTFNTTETLTKIVEQVGSFNEISVMWGRIAPSQTTANVVLVGASAYYVFGLYSLTGADSVLPATTAVAGGDSSTASLSITPTVDNCWIIDSIEYEAVPTMTTASGVSDWTDEGASYQHGGGSHFVQTTAAAKTMSYSGSYGSRWNICACAVKPVAVAAGQPMMKRNITLPYMGRNQTRFGVTLSALKSFLSRSLNFNT